MAIGGMALLTQLRWFGQQHGFVDTAMRVMTAGAVVCNRSVFPQLGPALFGVAAVTVFVDRHLFQAGVPKTAVRIVAVAADHLLCAYRVSGTFVDVGTLL